LECNQEAGGKPVFRRLARFERDLVREGASTETMNGCRSHWARFTIWEDALAESLVAEGSGPRQVSMQLKPTCQGRDAILGIPPQSADHQRG